MLELAPVTAVTRCPMECRLTNSQSPFSCQISIHREFVPNSNERLAEPSETPFGDVITDKADVEPALRRAQLSALDPSLPLSRVTNATDEDLKSMMDETVTKVAFTRDVVCIDLRGPELTDLVFIDLPGLIQNAEPHVVKLVKDIIVSYIKGRCLILVAVPMTEDIQTQGALRLAREADPEGLRTIGVLTKPDMLTTGNIKSLEKWIQVFEGRGDENDRLTHGYYCIRQLNDEERLTGVTTTGSRQIEATFFNETNPWNQLSARDRLGMPNLIDNLGRLLVSYIEETLKIVNAAANDLMADCHSQLSKLPASLLAPDEAPGTCMLRLITELSQDVSVCIRGMNAFGLRLNYGNQEATYTGLSLSKTTKMIQAHRAFYKKFKTAIHSTAPNFVPWEDQQSSKMKNAKFVNSLEDGEDDESDTTKGLGEGERFTLTKMKKHIDSAIARELPNNIPFSAKAALIVAFQSTWPDTVYTCLNEVKWITLEVLIERVNERFGQYGILKHAIISHITELTRRHYDICILNLQTELEKELSPFTQNTRYLDTCTEKWLVKYKAARNGGSSPLSETDGKEAKKPNTTQSFATPPSPTGAPAPASKPAFSFATPPSPTPAPASAPAFANPQTRTPKAAEGKLPVNGNAQNGNAAAAPFGNSTDNRQQPFNAFLSSQQQQDPQWQTKPFAFARLTSEPFGNVPAQDNVRKALAALAEIGYNVTAEDLPKLVPVDEFENELRVMAEVRGYFEVAYKRIIDNIPSVIDLRFVRAIANKLQEYLVTEFKLGTPDANETCAPFLAEDTSVANKRGRLLAKQRRLLTVSEKLAKFGIET